MKSNQSIDLLLNSVLNEDNMREKYFEALQIAFARFMEEEESEAKGTEERLIKSIQGARLLYAARYF